MAPAGTDSLRRIPKLFEQCISDHHRRVFESAPTGSVTIFVSTVPVVAHGIKVVAHASMIRKARLRVFWALEGLGVAFPANVSNYRSLGGFSARNSFRFLRTCARAVRLPSGIRSEMKVPPSDPFPLCSLEAFLFFS